jgi:hypothetical protein
MKQMTETPSHILVQEAAETVMKNLLPAKSATCFWKAYEGFKKWCNNNNTNNVYNEYVLLAYFDEK